MASSSSVEAKATAAPTTAPPVLASHAGFQKAKAVRVLIVVTRTYPFVLRHVNEVVMYENRERWR
jgi:hypothetical protein